MNLTAVPTGTTATKNTLVWGMRPAHLALLGVALVTLFRFWYMCSFDLVPDEAYYWVWSKHFALSYRDKGPLVAWTIALGTHLFGDTVFGVRFFAVLLSAGTAFQLFRLAERLYDDRTALWCVGVAGLIPLFAVDRSLERVFLGLGRESVVDGLRNRENALLAAAGTGYRRRFPRKVHQRGPAGWACAVPLLVAATPAFSFQPAKSSNVVCVWSEFVSGVLVECADGLAPCSGAA